MAKKFLEGLKKTADGRYILRETVSVSAKDIKRIPLSETEIKEIQEKKGDSSGETPKMKYVIKVWDRGFNANERSYANVIDRVLKENKRTIGLMNHPEDEPDPEKIFAVEKNPFIDEDGWLAVEFYPCGFWGKLIEDVLLNDGPITVSSACLGDVDSEGYVINDETFELERYFDFVFGPSNRLNQYQTSTEKREDDGSVTPVSSTGSMGAKISEKSSVVNTHRDNATEEKNKMSERTGERFMPEKELLESTMKMNIRSMLREAEKTDNLPKRKEILSSAHSYASQIADSKLLEEIENETSKVDKEIASLTEKGQKTDELSQTVQTLTEKKETLEKDVASLTEEKTKIEEQLKTITEMYETKQYKSSEAEIRKSRNLAKEVCSLKLKNQRFAEKISKLERAKRIAERKALINEAEANTKADASLVQSLQEENKKLKARVAKLTRTLHESRAASFRSVSDTKNTDNRSRFQSMRKRMEEQREAQQIKDTKSLTENKQSEGGILDEDAKMEMMLNHRYN